MSDPVSQIGLVKAVLWEEAKGKLRALYMAEGQLPPVYDPVTHQSVEGSWVPIRNAVEGFIQEVEDKGYHE